MALSLNQTAALGKLMKSRMRIASMGYPDIIAPLPMLETLHDMGKLTYREDSEAICKRHGLKHRPIPDAHSFFEMFGCALHVYDIVQERGCETICDLNHPLDPILKAYNYDIVLDVGTTEHVVNVWQALVNMASMVKVGGHIIHENPHSGWGNHGFYSLHPTLFQDFYVTNGFEIVKCLLVARTGETMEVPMTRRFSLESSSDINIFCMAKRKEDAPFKFPKQSKYA